uniref:Uncharacterized protein n=1 Tax=Clastoptera arizonana TaxID=38151 RepID=A0A1B6CBZ0_9HEMI
MLLVALTILTLSHSIHADGSIWGQMEIINRVFLQLGLEPPPITYPTKEQMDKPDAELLMTELLNLNKQLKALKMLSKIPKRRFDKKVFKILRRILSEMRPSFSNLQLDDNVLRHQYHLTKNDIDLFNYLYDDTYLALIELNCRYNRRNT